VVAQHAADNQQVVFVQRENSTLTRTSCGPGGGGSSMSTTRITCSGIAEPFNLDGAHINSSQSKVRGCVILPNGYVRFIADFGVAARLDGLDA